MNLRTFAGIGLVLGALTASEARATECPGNPGALGTSRVMSIDPRTHPRIGTIQYANSLPLADKEVVLTFDDGPMPPYTNRVLEVLAGQCVKANFFIIGRMARGYPDLMRRIHAGGHVIGTHSQNHPLAFERMPLAAVKNEIEQGIASVTAALGAREAVAPFFRIPGLLRARQVEGYLQARGLTTWSADVVADDWKHLSAAEVVRRAMARLDEKGKGILLLHDIQPATALALPELLRQLKARGYRIVQVVPSQRSVPAVAAKPGAPATRQIASAEKHIAPPAPVAEATPIEQAAPAQASSARAAEQAPTEDPAPEARRAAASEPREAAAPVAPPGSGETAAPEAAAPPPAATETAPAGPAHAHSQAMAAVQPIAQPEHRAVRPLVAELKPSEGDTAAAGKHSALEPGSGPAAISVPVPAAGGMGISPLVRSSAEPDGRFQQRR